VRPAPSRRRSDLVGRATAVAVGSGMITKTAPNPGSFATERKGAERVHGPRGAAYDLARERTRYARKNAASFCLRCDPIHCERDGAGAARFKRSRSVRKIHRGAEEGSLAQCPQRRAVELDARELCLPVIVGFQFRRSTT